MQITVLSLMQPWATLVVIGAKRLETRGFDTPFRGELYIHASEGRYVGKGLHRTSCRELCYKDPFNKFINGGSAYDKLPFGKIIGKVNLIDTFPTGGLEWHQATTEELQEKAFGDYSIDRFAWVLEQPVQLKEPVIAKGSLKFWNYEMPENFVL